MKCLISFALVLSGVFFFGILHTSSIGVAYERNIGVYLEDAFWGVLGLAGVLVKISFALVADGQWGDT